MPPKRTTEDVGFKVSMSIPTTEWKKFKPEQRAKVYTAMGALIIASCRTKKQLKEAEKAIYIQAQKAHDARALAAMGKP